MKSLQESYLDLLSSTRLFFEQRRSAPAPAFFKTSSPVQKKEKAPASPPPEKKKIPAPPPKIEKQKPPPQKTPSPSAPRSADFQLIRTLLNEQFPHQKVVETVPSSCQTKQCTLTCVPSDPFCQEVAKALELFGYTVTTRPCTRETPPSLSLPSHTRPVALNEQDKRQLWKELCPHL